jgi:hypothetical protein
MNTHVRSIHISAGALLIAGAALLSGAIGACGEQLVPAPPKVPASIERVVTCNVRDTQCTGFVSDAAGNVTCPTANLVTTPFTATGCYTEPNGTSAADDLTLATNTCSFFFCSGLGPCSVALAAGQPTTPAPGVCDSVTGAADNGASEAVTCANTRRDCTLATTVDGEQYCSTEAADNKTFTTCFDPTTTDALRFCNAMDIEGLVGPIQFNRSQVVSVTPNSSLCSPTPVASELPTGVGAVQLGTVSVGGSQSALVAKGGFMTFGRSCDSDGEFCSTTLGSLQVQLQDLTVAGVAITNPEMQLAVPVTSGIGSPQITPTVQLQGDSPMGRVTVVASTGTGMTLTSTATTVTLGGTINGFVNVTPTTLVPLTATISISGSTTSPNATCGQETSQQRLLGFESLDDWTSTQASLALTSALHTQGCFGTAIGGSGYRTLNSRPFSTPLAGTTSSLSLDVFVPPNQPNQFWLGAIQMYLSCPPASFNNQYIGQAELTGLPVNAFSTVTYQIPSAVESALQESLTGCFFSIAVNTNATPLPPVLDNLRFR